MEAQHLLEEMQLYKDEAAMQQKPCPCERRRKFRLEWSSVAHLCQVLLQLVDKAN